MTNLEKQELRMLVKQKLNFEEIRELVDCSDSTIRRYIKVFNPTTTVEEAEL